MTDNQVVQSLWVGGRLSAMEQICIKSFQAQGHVFHLYCYDDLKGIPDGTIIKDANEIISHDKLFIDNRQVVASFADWFRYKLLYDKGGWWVDMDSICLKHFNIQEEYCFSTEKSNSGEAELNIGFIKAPRGASFLADCLEYIESKSMKNVVWGAFGPKLFRRVLSSYEWEKYTCSPNVFCPINWTEIYKFITVQEYVPEDDTIAIHLWNEMWRLARLPRDANYHPQSLYEQFKARFSS